MEDLQGKQADQGGSEIDGGRTDLMTFTMQEDTGEATSPSVLLLNQQTTGIQSSIKVEEQSIKNVNRRHTMQLDHPSTFDVVPKGFSK